MSFDALQFLLYDPNASTPTTRPICETYRWSYYNLRASVIVDATGRDIELVFHSMNFWVNLTLAANKAPTADPQAQDQLDPSTDTTRRGHHATLPTVDLIGCHPGWLP